jgi:hypothetical protein
LTSVNITEARSTLKARRLAQKWSFDALYADVVRVLGDRSPSPATLRRFVLKETSARDTTAHVIVEYLQSVQRVA